MTESKGEPAPLPWTLGHIHKEVEAVKILNRKMMLVIMWSLEMNSQPSNVQMRWGDAMPKLLQILARHWGSCQNLKSKS